MNIFYFAWVREKIGRAEEQLTPPPSVTDVQSLVAWLKERGGGYAEALDDMKQVRVAVNQDHAPLNTPLKPGDEIALFPPVTGG